MYLVEIASALRSSPFKWKTKGAKGSVWWWLVRRRAQVSVHRPDFALRLWEKAPGQILCNNDGGMKHSLCVIIYGPHCKYSLAIVFLFTLPVIKMGSLPASVCKTVLTHKLLGLLPACSS